MTNLNIERFFKSFPTMAHKRNRFPWEKEINWNMKLGEITPICMIRTVPGQTYNLDMSTVIKVAPMVVPPMDNAVIKFFAFYNPDRNTWKNYKYWFGEKQNPEDPENEPTYVVPKVSVPSGGFGYNTFWDNIGIPPETGGYKIDAFMSRTDRQIYNTYFRNQALENPIPVNTGDTNDTFSQNSTLRKICKPRDFFTQCLPTQSGSEAVEIPLGSYAPITGTAPTRIYSETRGGLPSGALLDPIGLYDADRNKITPNSPYGEVNLSANNGEVYGADTTMNEVNTRKTYMAGYVDANSARSTLIADLTNSMGAPLEGLYQAVAYNTYQYMTSRGGNRYFEHVSNIYGVVNPDGVLQQPEFLGSQSCMVDFDTVTQTSSTNGEATPLGNRGANGYAENYGELINKSFGEFGWIIIYGVATVYSKYQQGVSKLMQTEDPLELFNPLFNLMGDEPIYESEIFIQSDNVTESDGTKTNEKVFGYGKRHSRYLYPINEIHGEQRSSYSQSLDNNHFAQFFNSAPNLNKTFDKVTDEGFKRSLVVENETQFVCNSLITGTNDIEIPLEAIPSIIPNLDITGI